MITFLIKLIITVISIFVVSVILIAKSVISGNKGTALDFAELIASFCVFWNIIDKSDKTPLYRTIEEMYERKPK